MKIPEMKPKDAVCWYCKGKPEFMYFNNETQEILSVICVPCRDAFEGAIKGTGAAFCTDGDCKEHSNGKR